MSYSNSFPQQRPTLNLDFANSGKLDSRLSYSRSSGGTYMSSEKALSSENLLKQSQDFDTSWSRIHLVSSVSGGHSAPDGSSTGWLMTANTGTSQEPQLQQLFAVNSNTEYTAIAHLKAGTASHGYVSFRGGSGGHYAYAIIDFSAGTVADGGSGFTGISSSITALSDSWYKVTVTATSDSTTSSPYCFIGISDGSAFGSNGTAPYDSNGETMYAWGAQLSSTNSLVYDSPTTTQIAREYAPLLKTASADAPRFEFATDGQSVGLLIEAQKSNLALNSNDITAATWNKIRVNVSANSAIGPDGALSASLISETTDTSTTHYFLPLSVIASGYSVGSDKVTHSVFAKYAGRNLRVVDSYNPMDGGSTVFDLQNGVVSTGGGVMQDCGNGWWRCSVTATLSNSGNVAPQFHLVDGTTWPNANDAGDGYSGILIYGLQTEQQSMSSYITTGSASVSRASDSCSLVSAPLFDNGDTTVMCDVTFPTDTGTLSGGAYTRIFRLENSSTAAIGENYEVYRNLGGEIFAEADAGGSNVASYYVATSSPAGNYKLAVRYGSDSKAYLNGAAGVSSDSAMPNPTGLDTLRIGSYSNTGGYLDGHIKRLSLFNVALSDLELQSLTSNP